MAAVDRTELEELRLYVDLARRLGLLHAQMCQGAIQRAELHYRGEVARRSTRADHGRLRRRPARIPPRPERQHRQRRAAGPRARHRDRRADQLAEGRFQHAHHGRRARPTRRPTPRPARCSATSILRLVQLGPYHLDAYMDGVMLIFTHRDVPGLIGFIGTIFGKHQVNIAQMTVGRQQPGGEAIAVLNLDSPPPEEALQGSAGASADQQRQRGQAAAGRADAAVVRIRGISRKDAKAQRSFWYAFFGPLRLCVRSYEIRLVTRLAAPGIADGGRMGVVVPARPPRRRAIVRRRGLPPHAPRRRLGSFAGQPAKERAGFSTGPAACSSPAPRRRR